MLSGWKVNIISKSKLQERVKMAVENLFQLDKLNEASAQVLVQSGVMSIIDLSASDAEDIQKILEIELSDAQALVAQAAEAIENPDLVNEPEEEAEIVSASAVPSARMGMIKDNTSDEEADEDGDKFSDAERRLREELAAFKLK